jgi:hypothetical protein
VRHQFNVFHPGCVQSIIKIHCSVQKHLFVSYYLFTLCVLIDVDYHQAFSANPQNQGKILDLVLRVRNLCNTKT